MATSITTGVNTQADAQARLQMWLDAEQAVASAQSYAIDNRSLTRASLAEIRERIGYWQRQVMAFKEVARGGRGAGHSVMKWIG